LCLFVSREGVCGVCVGVVARKGNRMERNVNSLNLNVIPLSNFYRMKLEIGGAHF